jgi:hypothetical protein
MSCELIASHTHRVAMRALKFILEATRGSKRSGVNYLDLFDWLVGWLFDRLVGCITIYCNRPVSSWGTDLSHLGVQN